MFGTIMSGGRMCTALLLFCLPICGGTQAAQAPAVSGGVSYAVLDVVAPVKSCASLADFELTSIGGTGSRITAATEKTSSLGMPVCAVEGSLAPAINFAVQLPVNSWSQRYLQVGCGGLCGSIAGSVGAADGCVPLKASGFVLASTDMGHQDQDGTFGKDPVKRSDFAYRAQHLTAMVAKALILDYYGQPQKYAYFTGCSDGGREALIEAQRYPDDFDGIIAGAGAINFQVQNAIFHAWQAVANTGSDGKAILVAARLPVLHNAVVEACDGIDGLKDGLIANPLVCHFDPVSVQCPASATDTGACLTAEEVGVARKFYDGPRDPITHKRLTVGGPQFGSELAWAGVYVPQSAKDSIFSQQVSLPVLRNMAFEHNPPANFSLADMHFDETTFDKLRLRHRLFDATNPDLSAFASKGGKLIVWHGWSDPHISPVNSIAYYTAMRQFMGTARTDAFARLYIIPGMYHCANGEGPYQIDLLTPMMNWVEGGVSPQAIETRQPVQTEDSDFGAPRGTDGKHSVAVNATPGATAARLGARAASREEMVQRARPVYPWPYTAVWNGKTDSNLPSSFVRGPAIVFTMPDWLGADFFAPYRALAQ